MLMRKGYRHMVVQIGNGTCEPEGPAVENFHLDWYRFKPSLKPDMSEASLIISHGGMYTENDDIEGLRQCSHEHCECSNMYASRFNVVG